MLARLSLRLRVLLIFAGLAAAVIAAVAIGLWLGYSRLDDPGAALGLVQAGVLGDRGDADVGVGAGGEVNTGVSAATGAAGFAWAWQQGWQKGAWRRRAAAVVGSVAGRGG